MLRPAKQPPAAPSTPCPTTWPASPPAIAPLMQPAARAGPTGTHEVLDVVAPDEHLLAHQSDPLHQRAGEQHAVEGDDDPLHQPVTSRGLDVGEPVDDS